jgi:hypothetical protein
LLTFTEPIRLVVPEVSVIEPAGDLAAAVGIKRRTLEKRNSSARLFFMKGEASPGFNITVPDATYYTTTLRLYSSVQEQPYHFAESALWNVLRNRSLAPRRSAAEPYSALYASASTGLRSAISTITFSTFI